MKIIITGILITLSIITCQAAEHDIALIPPETSPLLTPSRIELQEAEAPKKPTNIKKKLLKINTLMTNFFYWQHLFGWNLYNKIPALYGKEDTHNKLHHLFSKIDTGNSLDKNDIPILMTLRAALSEDKPLYTIWQRPRIPSETEKRSLETIIHKIDTILCALNNMTNLDHRLSLSDLPLLMQAYSIQKPQVSPYLCLWYFVVFQSFRTPWEKIIIGDFFPYSKSSLLLSEFFDYFYSHKHNTTCKIFEKSFDHTLYMEMVLSNYNPQIHRPFQFWCPTQGRLDNFPSLKSAYREKNTTKFIENLIQINRDFRTHTIRCLFSDRELTEQIVLLHNQRQANLKKIINLMEKEEIWVLSLDGGGIRGLLSAYVLKEISQQTDKPIIELFDFFAGTSVGGLIGLGLTAPAISTPSLPQYSIEYICDLLEHQGEEIFPPMNTQYKLNSQVYSYAYNPDKYEELLRKKFENTYISELVKPTLVTAVDITNSMPTFFASYKTEAKTGVPVEKWPFRPEQNIRIWEAARATTAAPTFFPHKTVYQNGLRELIDGGVTTNNPTLLALQEIQELRNSFGDKCKIKKINVLSLGTGNINKSRPFGVSGNMLGIKNVIHFFADIGVNAGVQQTHTLVENFLDAKHHDQRHPIDYTYYRFNPQLEENIELDDVSPRNIQKLKNATPLIFESNDFRILIDHFGGTQPEEQKIFTSCS